ncbi:MAG: hypothetical protein HQK96_09355 [Nitrospirae bacterium]|nr:hypothetical protein [Nitrospirota bacterium]
MLRYIYIVISLSHRLFNAYFNNSMSCKTIIKTIMTLIVAMLLQSHSFADMPAPETYTVKAKLALKKEKYQDVKSLPFYWNMNMITPENNHDGWINKRGNLVWLPGGKDPIFQMPLDISGLKVEKFGISVFSDDFNELWIDYNDINPQNPCDIGIVFNLNPITDRNAGHVNYEAAVGGNKPIGRSDVIDVDGSDNENWHYAQDGNRTVIKRQFHKNISTVEDIVLEFSFGVKISDIYLRVAFKDKPKPDATVKWKLPKDVYKDDVRISIGRHLRENYPGEHTVFLKEIIVYLDDDTVDRVINARPFKRLRFMYATMIMPSQTYGINTGLKRIKMDIKGLSDLYNKTTVEKALFYAIPSNKNDYCGIQLKEIKAVNNNDEGERPIVLSAIDNVTRTFGGSSMDISGDNVEVLKFLDYYSFESKIKEISNKIPLSIRDNSTGGKELLMDSPNVKIIAAITNPPLFSSHIFNDNDQGKEGKVEARIEILWSTKTIIEENTHFILRLSSGVEFVKGGLLTITSESGEQFRRIFNPNEALDLADITGRITKIRLRMDLNKDQFSIKLKDMALFTNVSLPLAQALKMPHPVEVSENLYPEIYDLPNNIIDTSPGFLKGIVWSGDFKWNTRVDNQTGIKGVIFNFKNSRTVNADNPCWLNLTFIGEHHQESKDICGESQNGQVYITIPDIFSDGGADKLRLIKWKIDIANQMYGSGSPLSINYQMYINKYDMQSIGEKKMNAPILSVRGKNFYTTTDVTAELLHGEVWLDMGTMTLHDTINDIRVLDHPYIQVKSVVAAHALPSGQQHMPDFEKQGQHLTSPWPVKLENAAPFVFIISILAFVWLKGWGQWLWQKIKSFMGFIMSCLRTTREGTWAKLLHGNIHKTLSWVKTVFWIVLSCVIYSNVNPKDSLFYTVGSLTGFMALRSLLWLIRPMIIMYWNAADQRIYEEKGNVYILGFMVTIVGCAVLLVLKREIVAEQLAIIGYYCLVAGVVQKAWQMKKEAKP